MFDLAQLGMPMIVDAHDKKWVAVYSIRSTDEASYFVAIEAQEDGKVVLPAAAHVIEVPFDAATIERRRKAKEKP